MKRAVLLLAGTAEAREFAGRFSRPDLRFVASLAGVTESPHPYPCETRVGGFGGVEGMARWLEAEDCCAIVDASHPFAEQISAHGIAAAAEVGIPYLALRRAAWAVDGRAFADADALAKALLAGARVFLTVGRGEIGPFVAREDVAFLLRSIEPVAGLPRHMKSVLGRPPFSLADEIAAMRDAEITHLVTKNAGGARPAKLDAASALGVEIFSIEMPSAPESVKVVETVEAALHWIGELRS